MPSDDEVTVEASPVTASPDKEETVNPSIKEIEEDDDDFDETMTERLWGLTEMFPEWIINGSSSLVFTSLGSCVNLLHLSRNIMWIFFSSSAILVAPVLFEVERGQIEEAQKQQQRQILLGPNAAVSGTQPGMGMPMPPPPQR